MYVQFSRIADDIEKVWILSKIFFKSLESSRVVVTFIELYRHSMQFTENRDIYSSSIFWSFLQLQPTEWVYVSGSLGFTSPFILMNFLLKHSSNGSYLFSYAIHPRSWIPTLGIEIYSHYWKWGVPSKCNIQIAILFAPSLSSPSKNNFLYTENSYTHLAFPHCFYQDQLSVIFQFFCDLSHHTVQPYIALNWQAVSSTDFKMLWARKNCRPDTSYSSKKNKLSCVLERTVGIEALIHHFSYILFSSK